MSDNSSKRNLTKKQRIASERMAIASEIQMQQQAQDAQQEEQRIGFHLKQEESARKQQENMLQQNRIVNTDTQTTQIQTATDFLVTDKLKQQVAENISDNAKKIDKGIKSGERPEYKNLDGFSIRPILPQRRIVDSNNIDNKAAQTTVPDVHEATLHYHFDNTPNEIHQTKATLDLSGKRPLVHADFSNPYGRQAAVLITKAAELNYMLVPDNLSGEITEDLSQRAVDENITLYTYPAGNPEGELRAYLKNTLEQTRTETKQDQTNDQPAPSAPPPELQEAGEQVASPQNTNDASTTPRPAPKPQHNKKKEEEKMHQWREESHKKQQAYNTEYINPAPEGHPDPNSPNNPTGEGQPDDPSTPSSSI